MGFIKNIGKAIKKATKKISFKNLVKVAGSFDPTGIVSGIQASHEAKKEEKKALAEQKAAQLEYDKQVLANNESEAKKQLELMELAQQNAEYQRMVIASNTQAIGGKVGLVGGSIVGQIGSATMQAGIQSIDQNLQKGLAQAGANMANQTITEWLKIHWWKLLLGVVVVGIGLRFLIGGKRR